MAANKIVRFGPTTCTAAAKNLINPGTATAGTGISPAPATLYVVLRHFRLNNTTASPITVSMFIGATAGSAAGTEFSPASWSVPANSFVEWAGAVRLDNADFLTQTASGAGVTFDGEGEIGVA
jgi:hypothetical protein